MTKTLLAACAAALVIAMPAQAQMNSSGSMNDGSMSSSSTANSTKSMGMHHRMHHGRMMRHRHRMMRHHHRMMHHRHHHMMKKSDNAAQ